MFGFLNINKHEGCTSRDAVNLVQRCVKPSKIGHAGTLDPLATGVLVICIGPATRLAQYVQRMPKSYVADFRLGYQSDTEDVMGEVHAVADSPVISRQALERVLPDFVGEILQRPPIYSALKIKGQRAYQLARAGESVELESRPVFIHGLHLSHFEFPNFQIEINCGSGTYVRSLGRDIALRLGTHAIMTGLVRTAIGDFKIADAISSVGISRELVEQHLLPPQRGIADVRVVTVSDEDVKKFANGCDWSPDIEMTEHEILALDESDRLLAVLKQRNPQWYTPKINFAPYWLNRLNRLNREG